MATYYVGKGGSDSNNGTTWALRKLTIQAGENLLASGDTLYIGPGVYRESIALAVAGPTWIGDITGEHTDGIGGTVRITGSDNDQTVTRSTCVNTARATRTFKQIDFDMATTGMDPMGSGLVIEDCSFCFMNEDGIRLPTASAGTITLNRCIFAYNKNYGAVINPASERQMTVAVNNCLFLCNEWAGFLIREVYGPVISQCLFMGNDTALYSFGTIDAADNIIVRNCIFMNNQTAITASQSGDVSENYNSFWGNGIDRQNTATGANSNAYPPLFEMPKIVKGIMFPWSPFRPAEHSPLAAIEGNFENADDFFGITRPVTGKRSRGPFQFQNIQRATDRVYSTGPSLKMADAARAQFSVPQDGTQITVSVRVYREADYAGTLPQMVIKQPGQADITVTDAGSAAAWNLLTHTFTPAVDPEFIIVELASNNSATTGNYIVWFDELKVE